MTDFVIDVAFSDVVDLGHDVSASVCRIGGKIEAVVYWHTCNGEPKKRDSVIIKPAWKDGWEMASETPLTLSPSLLCRICGHHGFIREGKWVPA